MVFVYPYQTLLNWGPIYYMDQLRMIKLIKKVIHRSSSYKRGLSNAVYFSCQYLWVAAATSNVLCTLSNSYADRQFIAVSLSAVSTFIDMGSTLVQSHGANNRLGN